MSLLQDRSNQISPSNDPKSSRLRNGSEKMFKIRHIIRFFIIIFLSSSFLIKLSSSFIIYFIILVSFWYHFDHFIIFLSKAFKNVQISIKISILKTFYQIIKNGKCFQITFFMIPQNAQNAKIMIFPLKTQNRKKHSLELVISPLKKT